MALVGTGGDEPFGGYPIVPDTAADAAGAARLPGAVGVEAARGGIRRVLSGPRADLYTAANTLGKAA